MKQYDSKLFGKIHEPESFCELMELVTYRKQKERTVRMWRGQSNINWRLDSTAFRRLLSSGKIKHNSSQQKAEMEIISYEKYLLKKADYYGFRYINGHMLSDIELLARLRHYGAATRLVDFSRNVLIASWFSASQENGEYGVLFGLHCDYIGGTENCTEMEFLDSYENIVANLDELSNPITWTPHGISPRDAAQHSQFLYSSVSNSKRGSLKIEEDKGSFFAIAISPKLKIDLKDILEKSFDIYHFSLFPDIEGFSKGNTEQANRWVMERW